MSKVELNNVTVLDNPAKFTDPIRLEILFTCYEELPYDLEWKIVYVGSADTDKHDQVLDSVLMGALVGVNKFIFQVDAPDPKLIPSEDLIGVSAILLSCSYCIPNKDAVEFVRVGYYVSTYYESDELMETPPPVPEISRLIRKILHEEPRVTRFLIEWGTEPNAANGENPVMMDGVPQQGFQQQQQVNEMSEPMDTTTATATGFSSTAQPQIE